MNQTPLIFVYLGSQLPEYAFHSLSLARRNFQGPIYVLVDRLPKQAPSGVECVDISSWYNVQPFRAFEDNSPLDALFRGGFWLKAVERFFVLEQFQRYSGYARFFHAELDVLVLNLSGYSEVLDSRGKGIFVPAQRPKRAIASLVYVNKPGVLQGLLDFFHANAHLGNEMNMLGHFLAERPDIGFALPSENSLDSAYWSSVTPSVAPDNGVIDSLGFGPWLLGYDPRNVPGSTWNKFREGAEGVDLQKFFFRSSIVPKSLEVSLDRQTWTTVRALHVHSKIFSRLRIPGVLSFYAGIARFPFRFPINPSFGDARYKALTHVLSRRAASIWLRTPTKLRYTFGRVIVDLVSSSPKILSQRERRVVLSFLRAYPIGSAENSQHRDGPKAISQSNLPRSLDQLLALLGRDSRRAVEFQIRIFADALDRDGPALYTNQEGSLVDGELIGGKKQCLYVTDEKAYVHSKHALTFWAEHPLNNRWSFVGPYQLIQPNVVWDMFPQGEDDIFRWAEMGLRAGMDSLSAFQSYGTYLFSRYRRRVRLVPFPHLEKDAIPTS